jgi:CelD/BcsL family acetyltransferase involved in cellulose biosynthesis
VAAIHCDPLRAGASRCAGWSSSSAEDVIQEFFVERCVRFEGIGNTAQYFPHEWVIELLAYLRQPLVK